MRLRARGKNLTPGRKYFVGEYEGTFIKRLKPWETGRASALNVFEVPAFILQPGERGWVEMNDWQVRKKVTVEVAL